MTKSAVLLSGGMDSSALTYEMRPEVAVTIDYGQRPAFAEITTSTRLTQRLGIRHEVIRVDFRELGSGDLSDKHAITAAPASDWWPYRNQALITLAAMKLIGLGIGELYIATVRSDSIHMDGTAEFIARMDDLMRMQEGNLQILAPAIELSTVELVRRSNIPFSLLAWSHSCHTDNIACGQCRGCVKHRTVADELGYAKT